MADDEDIAPAGAASDEPAPPPAAGDEPANGQARNVSVPRFGGSAEPGTRRRAWRHLPPLLGLALFVYCLWGLLSGGTLPAWRPGWLDGHGVTNAAGIAVVIDPGHGGGDSGAVAHGMVEKELNLDVGQRVARVLRSHGVGVRLTREDDRFIPLEDRVRQANALPGAIFVSIHFNDASGDGKAVGRASGIETFYSENKEAAPPGWVWTSLLGGLKPGLSPADGTAWAVREGQTLADTIQGSLITGTAATDRGIKERSLYVTRRVHGPAVLVEGGFVSHPAESRLLGDTAYRQKLADSIAVGILNYLEAARHAPATAPVVAVRAGG